MKKLMILIAVVFAGVVFYMKNLPQKVKVQVAIINTCGEQIWPLDYNVPNVESSHYDAQKKEDDYIFEVDDVLYLSFLQNYNADFIRVWEVGDDRAYVDYKIDNYLTTLNVLKEKPKAQKTKSYTLQMSKIKRNIKAQKGTNPYGRDNMRLKSKGGFYDLEKATLAHKTVKKLIKNHKNDALSRDAGLRKWESLGPGNIGGRIRTIAPHPSNPDIILLGSISGGIWRTTNGGNTWTNMSDFLPNVAIGKIIYNPINPNIVYASTGEAYVIGSVGQASVGIGSASRGVGILKSLDGGLTWAELDQQPPLRNWIGAMALDPNNPEHIYIGVANTNVNNLQSTTDGRVLKSTDGGDSWVYCSSVISSIPLDIEIRPENSNFVYVGCADHAYRSTNAAGQEGNGVVFHEITDDSDELPSNSGRVEFSLAPNSPNRLYASLDRNKGEIWRSIDDGATWTKRNILNEEYLGIVGGYANTIWVDPVNSNRLIVGGVDLWRSVDGGQNLLKISDSKDNPDIIDLDGDGNIGNSLHADQHIVVEVSDYDGTNRKVFIGNDGGIASTNNIATAIENSGWIDLNNNLQITQFYGGAVSKDGSFVIGGAQDNAYITNSNGGGINWDRQTTGDGAFAAINPDDENIAYVNLNNNQIIKTTDGGNEWNSIARFGGEGLAFCATFQNGCSIPFGNFEVQDSAALISRFIMDKNDPEILYAGASRLWKNDDAGDNGNWSVVRGSVAPGSYVAIETGNNSNVVWTGTDTGILSKSDDGGDTWQNMFLPQLPARRYVTDIAVSTATNNKVAVTVGRYGTDNIWLTTDGGSNWTNISLSFNMQVNTITWHPTKENWLYIGTDFGVFASENNGSDWSILPIEDDNEGPYNGEVSELFWSGDGSDNFPPYLYATTFGRGMWKTSAPLRDKIYVDRLYTGLISNGGFTTPFRTAFDGFNAAGSGSEVIFLSSGTHNAEPSSILLDRKVKITLQNGGASVLIK